ncbi:MAG: xanthine dehydrogenase molybdopterin binding subunit, partial [Myxococcales bacterium]|nr:xanthine dehydrogenase molybdopterin binding subunit [Myxococcales bacterium]
MNAPNETSSPLGRGLPHESALRHVSGEARYIDDLPHPPGMLVGMVLGSPVAHGRIVGRSREEALRVPGVHGVWFAEDVPGENNVGPVVHDEPLLADTLVHCVGQPVAFVVAESYAAARKALEAIRLEIEELPAITDIQQGIARGSFIGATHTIERGDSRGAIDAASHRLSGTVDNGGQEHFYLETHASLAIPGEDRQITVYCSTQHPSEVQVLVAKALGWGRSRVTVECPRMGGGFGGKETQAAQFACMAAMATVKTGRPVKVWLCRDDDMTLTGRRHPFHTRWEVGFDDAGRILGLQADLHADGGWATDLSLSILDRGLFHMDNAYWLPNVRMRGFVVRTNRVSNTAFRGFGGPQGMVVIEHVMERVAAKLGLDPAEVRRRNFYGEAPNNLTPYGQEVTDFRMHRIFDELIASSDLVARRAEVAAFNATHRWRKRAIALAPVKFGISFTASFLNQAGAYVLLYADGTVQLNHGGTEMGQGLYTKMLQICAHALGAPLSDIVHQTTSTAKVPNTSATAASSGSDLNGQAVAVACETLVERLKPVAAGLLGCRVDAMHVAAGNTGAIPTKGGVPAWAWHGGEVVTLAEVATKAYLSQVPMAAAGFYRTPDIGYDRTAGKGKPFHYFAYGASVSEVEVDGLTGEWRALRVDILHDVGSSLSEDIDKGQVEGAYVQGLGWLTFEELVFDDRGFLTTHSPSTYKIPAIGDVPEDFRVSLLERAPQDGVIYGSKAVGEPPFMLAIGTHHAISRAVSAFGPPGT